MRVVISRRQRVPCVACVTNICFINRRRVLEADDRQLYDQIDIQFEIIQNSDSFDGHRPSGRCGFFHFVRYSAEQPFCAFNIIHHAPCRIENQRNVHLHQLIDDVLQSSPQLGLQARRHVTLPRCGRGDFHISSLQRLNHHQTAHAMADSLGILLNQRARAIPVIQRLFPHHLGIRPINRIYLGRRHLILPCSDGLLRRIHLQSELRRPNRHLVERRPPHKRLSETDHIRVIQSPVGKHHVRTPRQQNPRPPADFFRVEHVKPAPRQNIPYRRPSGRPRNTSTPVRLCDHTEMQCVVLPKSTSQLPNVNVKLALPGIVERQRPERMLQQAPLVHPPHR